MADIPWALCQIKKKKLKGRFGECQSRNNFLFCCQGNSNSEISYGLACIVVITITSGNLFAFFEKKSVYFNKIKFKILEDCF